MPTAELIDYIQTQTQEGVSAQELRVSLMEAGWHESDIENGLHDVAAGLHPATPGASIHEDLAQVRGMVAHLATRIKGLEATIASFASAPAPLAIGRQAQLPSAFIGPDHELSGRRQPGLIAKMLSFVTTVLAAVFLVHSSAGLIDTATVTLQDFHIILGAFGLFFLVISIVLLRRGNAWSAWLWCSAALAIWATDTVRAWRVYHAIEWTIALALGILFLVIALVVRRWGVRLASS